MSDQFARGPLARLQATPEQDRLSRLEAAVSVVTGYYTDLLARVTVAEALLEQFRANGQKLTHRVVCLEAETMPDNPSRYQQLVMARKRLEALGFDAANQVLLTMMDEATRKGDRIAMLALNEPLPGLSDNRMIDFLQLQRLREQQPPGMPGTRHFWEQPEQIALVERVEKAMADVNKLLDAREAAPPALTNDAAA